MVKAIFPRAVQLIIVLILAALISSVIWNQFIMKDKNTAQDYRTLSMFSPDLIISYQEKYPSNWKDYIAILSAQHQIKDQNESIIIDLHKQISEETSFKDLVWPDKYPEYIKTAKYYRTILDKYPVYTPGNYEFPLKEPSYFVDTYGADREGGERTHEGTDLFDEKGTPILNVCDGKVEKLGWNRLGGERVGVRGDDGNYYYYAHLDEINKDLTIGEKITKGELIGTMGNTGDAITTPDHLHFGIELPDGEWLNPYPLLKVWEYHGFGKR